MASVTAEPLSVAAATASSPELPDGRRYSLLAPTELANVSKSGMAFKTLHLVRHAQAQHNAACIAAGGDRSIYLSEALVDARLTDLGRTQADALRDALVAAAVEVDVVLVSPLSRCCETARIAFSAGSRFVATETCRERSGQHPCDRRRTRTELEKDFPEVDFSALATDEDASWTAERESEAALVARAEAFCAELAARPEDRIAVVAHNDFLQALLLRSRLHVADAALRVPFENARHGSGLLTWQ